MATLSRSVDDVYMEEDFYLFEYFHSEYDSQKVRFKILETLRKWLCRGLSATAKGTCTQAIGEAIAHWKSESKYVLRTGLI